MAWLTGFDKRIELTIDSSKIDSNLTHFPVPIILDSDHSYIFDELGSNDKKIAVTKSDGTTQLYVEIEQWDDSNEDAVLWVSKSDWVLSSSADTTIYLYYDSTTSDNTTYVGDVGSRTEVWDSNFKGVWHLAEPSGQAIDSTSNNYDLSAYNSPLKGRDGKINSAWDFESSSSMYAQIDSAPVTNWPFTLQGWIKPESLSDAHTIVFVGDKDSGTSHVSLKCNIFGEANFFIHNYNTTSANPVSTNTISVDEWGFFVGTGTTGKVITAILNADFTNEGSAVGTQTISGNDSVAIGADRDSSPRHYADGIIDEVRISDIVRSDDWIKADYYAQSNDLISFSDPVISIGTTDKTCKSKTRINGSIDSMGDESSLILSVEYGTTDSYGSESDLQNVYSAKDISVFLKDLTADTTYHYRWKATNDNGTWYSADDTFDTLASNVKVGQFTINGTGNKAVTGLGFQPDIVLLSYESMDDDGILSNLRQNFGAFDSEGNQFTIAWGNNEGLGTSDIRRRASESKCLMILDLVSWTINQSAEYVSMDTDGFTINVDIYPDSSDRRVHFIAIGGAEAAKVGSFKTATTTGYQNITDTEFRPDCLLTFGLIYDVLDTNINSLYGTIGIADGDLNQECVSFYSGNGQPASNSRRGYSDSKLYSRIGSSAIDAVAELKSYLYNGFCLDWTDVESSSVGRYIFYIALKGFETKVSSTKEKVTTGDVSITDVGFEFQGLITLFGGEASPTTSNNAILGMGFCSNNSTIEQNLMGGYDDNGSDPIDTGRVMYDEYVHAFPWSTLEARAKVISVNSNGYVLNFDTASNYERYIPFLAFKEKTPTNDKLYVESGQIEIDSTSAISVEGLGFKPDLVLFQYIGAENGSWTNGLYSFGAVDKDLNKFCVMIRMDHGAGTTDTRRWCSESYISGRLGVTDVIDHRFTINSIDDDGFTIQSADYPDSNTRFLSFIAIGNLEDAKVFSFDSATSTGTRDITDVGFQPDALMLASAIYQTLDTAVADAALSLGFCDGDLNQYGSVMFSDDNQATSDCARLMSDDYIYNGIIPSSIFAQEKISALLSNGFTMTCDTADSTARKIFGVALKGVDQKANHTTERTTTGTKSVTGIGFEFEALLTVFSSPAISIGFDTIDTNVSNGMGWAHGDTYGEQLVVGFMDDDKGTDPTITYRFQYQGSFYLVPWISTPALKANISDIGSDGFDLDFVTVDGSSRYIPYLAMKKSALPVSGASVRTDDASSITVNGAVLNGTITEFDTETGLWVSFVWGADDSTDSYPNQTTPVWVADASDVDTAFSVSMTDLETDTDYHFKAFAADSTGDDATIEVYGAEETFTTKSAPSITTQTPTGSLSQGDTYIQLNGNLTDLGGYTSVDGYFLLYYDGTLIKQTGDQTLSATGTFDQVVGGLIVGFDYSYKAVVNASGLIIEGNEVEFTAGVTTVQTDAVTNIDEDSAQLNGDLLSLSEALNSSITLDVYFEYGDDFENSTTPVTKSVTGVFNAVITGLTRNTEYEVRAVADNGVSLFYGETLSFITTVGVKAVTNKPVDLSKTGCTLKGYIYTNRTISYYFDGGVYEGEDRLTPIRTASSDGAVEEYLSGLSAGRTYYCRLVIVEETSDSLDTYYYGSHIRYNTFPDYFAKTYSKDIKWLFDVFGYDEDDSEESNIEYRWSTMNTSFDSNTYDPVIVPSTFKGITMSWNIGNKLVMPSDLTLDLFGSDYTNDLEGMFVHIRLIVDGVESRSWTFQIMRLVNDYGKATITLMSQFRAVLNGVFPTTHNPKDVFPSSDDNPQNDYCWPVILGWAYVPVMSVNTGSDRYYVLGEDGDYTLDEVASPKDWANYSEWEQDSVYIFQESSYQGYRLVQFLIAGSSLDNALWKSGNTFLMPRLRYYRELVKNVNNPASWVHFILHRFGMLNQRIDLDNTFQIVRSKLNI